MKSPLLPKTNRSRINATILTQVIVLLLFACVPHSSLELIVKGKMFSDAEVIVDGKKIGDFERLITNRSGEEYVDGKKIGQVNDRARLEFLASMIEELDYHGVFQQSVQSGLRSFNFRAKDGSGLEVKANITPGEHYIYFSYDKERGKLQWNSKEYDVIPGNPTIIE